MATQVQNRRGTTAEHSTFTGAVGEVTIDTDKDTVVVHDGATAGGRPLLREDQSNLPTSAPTTGIYNNSGALALSTNGTGRLFVDASGRILSGVSTSTANVSLQLQGNAGSPTGAAAVHLNRGETATNITSGEFLGVIRYCDSDNNAGVQLFGTAEGSWSSTSTPGQFTILTTPTGTTTGVERLRITSDGKVGIGTSSPGYLLTLDSPDTSASYTAAQFKTAPAASGTSITYVRLIRGNGYGGAVGGYLEQGVGAGLTFATADSGNLTERARIDSSGRLLVGTSTASTTLGALTAKLQVQGTSVFDTGITNALWESSPNPAQLQLVKSRGASIGTQTVVQNNDNLGRILFGGSDGTDFETAAWIQCDVDGTPGANDMPGRLVFSTTADGASSPTERLRIDSYGDLVSVGLYNNTSALGTNLGIASSGEIYRSTSSAKYKTDIETLEDAYADQILGIRPVWYKSTCRKDNPEHSWWGFIAEEVAAIDPRLVHWKTVEISYDENGSAVTTPCDPEPEGVAYDRFVPHLLNLIKRQKEQIEAMEARLSALEGV